MRALALALALFVVAACLPPSSRAVAVAAPPARPARVLDVSYSVVDDDGSAALDVGFVGGTPADVARDCQARVGTRPGWIFVRISGTERLRAELASSGGVEPAFAACVAKGIEGLGVGPRTAFFNALLYLSLR